MAAPIFPASAPARDFASALNRSPVDALRDAVDALAKRVAQLEADRPRPKPDCALLASNIRQWRERVGGSTRYNPHSHTGLADALKEAQSAVRGYGNDVDIDALLAELDRRANESPDRLALRVSDLEIKRDEFEKRLGDVEGYLRPLRDLGDHINVVGVTVSGADDPAVGSASPRTATSPTISEHNAALALGAISEALNVRISADYMNGFPAIRAWPDGEKPMNTPGYHAEHQNHLVDPVLLRRICSAIETAIASHEYQQGEFRAALQPKTKFDKPEVVRETDLPGLSERAMVDRMLAAIARATGRVITSTDGDDNVARFAGDADDRDIALFGAMLGAYKHWNLNDEPWSRPEVAAGVEMMLYPEGPETLMQLFLEGPTWDGNIVSKPERDDLIAQGHADRTGDGFTFLTASGVSYAIDIGRKTVGWTDRRWFNKATNSSSGSPRTAEWAKQAEERLVPRHKHTGINVDTEITWQDMEGMLLPLALVAQCSIKAHNGTWSLNLPYDRSATDRDRTIANHLVSAYRMISARA